MIEEMNILRRENKMIKSEHLEYEKKLERTLFDNSTYAEEVQQLKGELERNKANFNQMNDKMKKQNNTIEDITTFIDKKK